MSHSDTFFDQPRYKDLQQQLQDFFSSLIEMSRRHAHEIPGGVFHLDEQQQQELITQLNPYFRFEFSDHPELHGLPIVASGAGMLYLTDFEGDILGAETIADGDIVTGQITDVCVLPTPTIECLAASDESEIPVTSQILSPVLILTDGVFSSNYSKDSGFETEVDLANFQTCLPLAHYLHITTVPPIA